MPGLRQVLLTVIVLAGFAVGHATDGTDTDTVSGNWVKQLIANKFRINDPSIRYPKFPKFCVDVYNWGNRTFNTYDTTYVVGTGKNWKAYLKSYNWADSYRLVFSKDSQVEMVSDIYSDIGPSLCFMAVSLGYSWNANRLIHQTDDDRKTFNFNFCCALFSADFNYSYARGGVHIKHFGKYEGIRQSDLKLNNLSQETLHFDLYYFFNNRRYSQAAAYSYSKYQLRSAGSWMAGVGINHQNISMDFSAISPELIEYIPELQPSYTFHYTSYDLMGGYGYNWVFRPKWLFNITVLPSIGYKHSYVRGAGTKKDLFSANMKLMSSLTYNHRALFAGLVGRFDGHFNMSDDYTFFNAMESISLSVGARF